MIIAHLDLDAFFAAVEELEDPSLSSSAAIHTVEASSRLLTTRPGSSASTPP
jgi:nucleotidyltransferase/DNA polymerase involved in DNA repair